MRAGFTAAVARDPLDRDCGVPACEVDFTSHVFFWALFLTRRDRLIQIDVCELEAFAEIADVPGHPAARGFDITDP